ncbi:hypothetical protein GCM10023205_20730 [Yinghuangia aomiensis]|uniref:Uncharacterized protein n=1 Tax=Yinghuangia aomiensis TaxID=676205 RepID=A0ABP9H366_9ACTN
MRAGGDLGHDTAEPGVLVHARRDRLPEHDPVPDQPDPGLVARRLDPENHRTHRDTALTLGNRGSCAAPGQD